MSFGGKRSKKGKSAEGGEGMEIGGGEQNDPKRMAQKLQGMGNDTMAAETIKRQNAMLEVFLAWIQENYAISVCLNFFFVCFGFF